MKTTADNYPQPAVLPELEHLLVRAARRQAQPRLSRRRWLLAVAVATLLLAAGAAAATGVFQVGGGSTSEGTFSVETRPVPGRGEGELSPGSICLQLTYEGRGAAFGCGDPPSAEEPFGLLVSDPLTQGSREGVVYGLVAGDIAKVEVLLPGGGHREATTEAKDGLPGKFFAVVVPRLTRVEVVGYDESGKELARIGSLAPVSRSPHSHAEAVEQGEPAGFAPTAPTPSAWFFHGERITEAQATRLGLACVQGRDAFTCYRSSDQAEAARRDRERDGR
jgi:hypothetical protein